MSRRPMQKVRIWSIQDRSRHKRIAKPFVVRWVVDGDSFSQSFDAKVRAERYRSRLITAYDDGEPFDLRSGEPASWTPAAHEMLLYEWARSWLRQEWPDWAPRSRKAAVYSLARFLPLVHDRKAPAAPTDLRAHLVRTLDPASQIDASCVQEKWLRRWGLQLGELDRERLADVVHRLSIGDEGQQLAPATVLQWRKNAHACIKRAVELGHLDTDPWPPTPRGRNRRKANRKAAFDARRLPDTKGMAEIIRAIRSHQPGSRNYQLMTAIVYYAGLRPSEVAMLRPRALDLPETGWGLIRVTEADDGMDEPVEPKTGDRIVPIPPALVVRLRRWIKEHTLPADALMFRTRCGGRPSESNWARSLHRGCRLAERPTMRVYDCRHACATTWIREGVPLGEAARRLGHSVETLVSVYVGALDGDDAEANRRLTAAFGPTWGWLGEKDLEPTKGRRRKRPRAGD